MFCMSKWLKVIVDTNCRHSTLSVLLLKDNLFKNIITSIDCHITCSGHRATVGMALTSTL